MTIRLAVLLSGGGTSLENLIRRIEKGSLDAEPVCVIASRADAYGLERARRHGIPAHAIPRRGYADARSFNDAVHSVLDPAAPDLIVLAGFLSKLELRGYAGRVLNIHPALIPAFSGVGFYGERVHRAVLEAGVKLTGVTVHFCDEEYDHGPIVLQEALPVHEDDTVESLAGRVLALEQKLYPRAIQLFAEGRLRIEGNRVRIHPAAPGASGG